LQALPQRLAAGRVVEDALLHIVQADAGHVMHRAVQVPGLFAVELQERTAVLQHFGRSLQFHQELRDFGLDAAVAGDINLPARIDADHAHILDPRLGAIARAAAHRELDLVRRIHAP
jgi:hypothetical protein